MEPQRLKSRDQGSLGLRSFEGCRIALGVFCCMAYEAFGFQGWFRLLRVRCGLARLSKKRTEGGGAFANAPEATIRPVGEGGVPLLTRASWNMQD